MSVVQQHTRSVTPALQLTKAAENRILSYLRTHAHHKGLRLSVKKTGCSGLSYVLDYVDVPAQGDLVKELENDYFVSIDKKSYPYLSGVEIDFVKQGLNQKFVFNNPNQTGQCGCGESFTVQDQE